MLNLLDTLDCYLLDDIYKMAYQMQFNDVLKEMTHRLSDNYKVMIDFWSDNYCARPDSWTELGLSGIHPHTYTSMVSREHLSMAMNWRTKEQILNKLAVNNSIKFNRQDFE